MNLPYIQLSIQLNNVNSSSENLIDSEIHKFSIESKIQLNFLLSSTINLKLLKRLVLISNNKTFETKYKTVPSLFSDVTSSQSSKTKKSTNEEYVYKSKNYSSCLFDNQIPNINLFVNDDNSIKLYDNLLSGFNQNFTNTKIKTQYPINEIEIIRQISDTK